MGLLLGLAAIPVTATVFMVVVIELVQGMEPAGAKKRRRR